MNRAKVAGGAVKVFLAGVLAAFISGAAVAPMVTPVYAAEQAADQDQQSPPSDASQGEHNEHTGHHG